MRKSKEKSKITQSRTISTFQWRAGYAYVAPSWYEIREHEAFGSLELFFTEIGKNIPHSYGANSHDLLETVPGLIESLELPPDGNSNTETSTYLI